MHVGLSVPFQNPHDARSDADVYHHELGFALQAEMWGFDSVWTVEHHFTDYATCPDPLQLLTYLAGQTRRIHLGTGVIALPWHDPMRLAEQITLLDNLSGGRVLLGIGRGVAKIEYDGFRVPMDTASGRFLEYADVVLTGLEAGYLEADGEFLQQPRRELRPRPQHSFRGRTYAAAATPDSMKVIAELGVGLLLIVQKPWELVKEDLDAYGEAWRSVSGDDPPAPICSAFVFVDEDGERAEEQAREHIGEYHDSVLRHHRFDEIPCDAAVEDFVDLMPWGTPDQVLEKLDLIREMTGMGAFVANLCYGGMPYEEAERNIACFVDHVLPALKEWHGAPLGLATDTSG
jgi:alkanesulfonate monooxygenase SsuD/methylene tetrahydromethanopterin reductase-like flavin-dependent oxidoreductase (luciferase family)